MLLEARDRFGGRVWTQPSHAAGAPVELGAEFIHGRAAPTRRRLRRACLATLDAPSVHWRVANGSPEPSGSPAPAPRLEPSPDYFEEAAALMAHVDTLPAGEDPTFDAFLASPAARDTRPEVVAMARALVEGFDAADPARVSVRSIAAEWRGDSAAGDQGRPVGGYGPLVDSMIASLDPDRVHLRPRTVVLEVRWRRGEVRVHASGDDGPVEVRATAAIVTLPLGVLQAPAGSRGAVQFDPPLASKHSALGLLGSGPVVKVILQFRDEFWATLDGGRYADATFFHGDGLAFPTWWTQRPVHAPLLVGWAGGPRTRHPAMAGHGTVIESALASLQSIVPQVPVRERLVSSWFHDWHGDPFARGAYSYVDAGGGNAREQLAAPLDGTLFFAGEAADTSGDAGTVSGAIASGERAAREALAALNPASAP